MGHDHGSPGQKYGQGQGSGSAKTVHAVVGLSSIDGSVSGRQQLATAAVLDEESDGVDVEEDGGDDGADCAADAHVERPLEPALLPGWLGRQLALLERRVAVHGQARGHHHRCTTHSVDRQSC